MIPRFRFTLLMFCLLGFIPITAQTGLGLQETNACDEFVTDFIGKWNIPGASIAIAKDGELFYTRGFGQVDQNAAVATQPYHRFRLAGLSKTITAAAIMKLIEEGQLNLSDKVFGDNGILSSNAYSDFTITDDRIFDITVQHLLEHSAGWDKSQACQPYSDNGCDPVFLPTQASAALGSTDPASTEALIGFALELGLEFAPGSDFAFSNIGYVVLGEVIAAVSGASYEAYVESAILEPLGICDFATAQTLLENRQERESLYYSNSTATSAFDANQTVPAAYGAAHLEAITASEGWVGTAEDYLRFLLAIDGFDTVADILSPASITSLSTPSTNENNYAKGIQVDSDDNWWHLGSLPGSSATWGRTADGFVWVALFNKDTLINNEFSEVLTTDFNELILNCLMQLPNNFSASTDLFGRPTQAASEIQALVTKETELVLAWTQGSGDRRIMVVKEGAPVDEFPKDGTSYQAGDDLGNGNTVLFVSAGSAANIKNLKPNTTYYFKLIEFNFVPVEGTANAMYQVGCSASASFTTLPLNDNDCKCVSNTADDICEDFESFLPGKTISTQSNCWTTFSGVEGGIADANISTDTAFDGTTSLLVNGTGSQDVLLTLADRMFGTTTVTFQVYVPKGKRGFYNVQNSQAHNTVNLTIEFGNIGSGKGNIPQAKKTFDFPHDEWFEVKQVFDLTANRYDLIVDGTTVLDDYLYAGALGALNFYSQGNKSRFFVDAINITTENSASTGTGTVNLSCVDAGNLTVNGSIVLISNLEIRNNGDVLSPGSSVGFFLSDNPSFTTQDYYIGENFVKGLLPTETVQITFGTDFSQLNIPPGEYFVGYIVDYKNIVEESDEEDNNDCFFLDPKVTVAPAPKADLAIFDQGTLVVEGENINVTDLTIVNNGDADAPSSKVAFYLTSNDNVTTFDFEIGSATIPAVDANGNIKISFDGTFSNANLPDGTYKVGFIADVDDDVDESDEDNNTFVYDSPEILLPFGDPNLTCTDAGSLTFNDMIVDLTNLTIANTGKAGAGAFKVGIYLSENANFSTHDYLIGTVDVDTLDRNAILTIDFTKDLSNEAIPSGTYYLGFKVDDDNDVQESDETDNNNCYFDTPTVKLPAKGDPNLTCNNTGWIGINGTVIDITMVEILNTGDGPAGASHLGFYLSTNTTFTELDYFIGYAAVPALAEGESVMINFNVDVAGMAIPAGEYFIGYILDAKKEVKEILEIDNANCYFANKKITISAPNSNLVCKDVGTFSKVGNQVTITDFQFTNDGTGTAAGSRVGFYLSADENITKSDVKVGELYVDPLAPGASASVDFSVDISQFSIADGSYFFGFILDNDEAIDENNENDNTCFFQEVFEVPFDGKPNLACEDRGSMKIENDIVKISNAKIINNGDDKADGSILGIYFSSNDMFTEYDFLVKQIAVPALNPGETFMFSTEVDLTQVNIQAGEFFVGYIIDYKGEIEESNEADNNDCFFETPKVSLPLDGEPNLVCADPGYLEINSLKVIIGGLEVSNAGNEASVPTEVGFYASLDDNFTTDDILIGVVDIPAVQPGQTIQVSFETVLDPSKFENTTYMIGSIIDYQDKVKELYELDNKCGFKHPTITFPIPGKPDLACKDVGKLVVKSSTIEVDELKIMNIGDASAGETAVGFYLSKDKNITKDDIFIGREYIKALHPGDQAWVKFTGDISKVTDCGEYYVGIIADNEMTEHESSESNNICYYDYPKVTIACPDKGDLACKDLGTLTCDDWDMSIKDLKIQNIGDAKTESGYVCVVLSTDKQFNNSDKLVKKIYLPSLNAGQTAWLNANIELKSLNVSHGNYFVGIIIDCDENIDEEYKGNNLCHYDKVVELKDPAKPDLKCYSVGTMDYDDWDIVIKNLKVANLGDAASTATQVCIYLSKDKNFGSSTDILAKKLYLPALNPNYYAELSANIELMNLNIPYGEYYVGVVIDCEDNVHESNEDNNVCHYDKIVKLEDERKPDLTCKSVGELWVDDWDITLNGVQIRNTGDAQSGATEVCVYISKDKNFGSSTDILAKKISLKALNAGAHTTLPSTFIELDKLNIPYGNYYVGIVIDCEDKVHESNEDNNVCYYDKVLELPDDRKPDLTCKSVGTITCDDWDIFLKDIQVKNDGEVKSEATEVCVYLSKDKNFGSSSDYLVKKIYVPSLNAGAFATLQSVNIELMNLNVSYGNYFVGLVIDCENKVHESDEYNNECHYDKVVELPDPAKPDLTCYSLGTMTCDDWDIVIKNLKIANLGDASSDATNVCIYLSKDKNFGSSSDILVKKIYLPALNPNYYAELSANIELMSLNVPYGDYFVGVVIDCEDKVHESKEDNNECYYEKVVELEDPRKPDLECKHVGELWVNDWDITINNLQIKNTGDVKSDATEVCIYLSKDKNFGSSSDILAKKVDLVGLNAGAFVTLPSIFIDLKNLNVPYGNYHVGIVIDCEDKVMEEYEDNNICHYDDLVKLPDPRKPDLTCYSLGTMTCDDWDIVIKNLKVANLGDVKSDATEVCIYLSKDKNFGSSSDILVKKLYLPALSPNYYAELSANIELMNLNVPYGNYFVGVVIDCENKVHESKEDNNECYYEKVVELEDPRKPDLTCYDNGNLTIDDWDITIKNLRVKNIGDAASTSTFVCVYISKDKNITTGDIQVGKIAIPALQANESAYVSANIELKDLNIPYGDYYVGTIIDCDDKVHESNEDNNICKYDDILHLPDPRKPDLTCKDLGYYTVDKNWKLDIRNLKVQNIGDAVSEATKVSVYLSENTTITTNDIFLGDIDLRALNPGSFDWLSFHRDLEQVNIPYGNYFIGIIIDRGGKVMESNEDNNTCYYNDKFNYPKPGKPDLTCYSLGNITMEDDGDIHITNLKVVNQGDTKSAATRVGVYVSSNSTITKNDVFLGFINLPELASNQIAWLDFSGNVNSLNLAFGTYHIGIIIDDTEKVHEEEEDNNTCKYDKVLELEEPKKADLTCYDVGTLTCDDWDLTLKGFKVKNIGHAKSESFEVCIYLSKDKNFGSSSDILVKNQLVPAMNAGSIVTLQTINVELDKINVPSGNYFVGFVIDCWDKVIEKDEYNNECYHEKVVELPDPTPDLTCKDVGDITIDEWDITLKNIKIQNIGDGKSGATHVCVYLSKDKNFGSSSDILAKKISLKELNPGAHTTLPTTFIELMNLNVPYGSYYVGLVIDCEDKVTEDNEYNNECHYDKVLELKDPKADLTCKHVGELWVDDWDITLNGIQVKNIGDAKSNATHVCVYISKDKNFGSSSDILAKKISLKALNPGSHTTLSSTAIDLKDLNVPYGNYYVGLVIDCDGKVHESNEYNNTCHYDKVLELPDDRKADLTCKDVGDIYIDDWDIQLKNIKVQNIGDAKSDATHVCVYLSKDKNFGSSSDILVKKVSLKALNAGAHTTLSNINIELMNYNIPYGSYNVGLVIDCDDKVHESNEYNNTCHYDETLELEDPSKPDLTCHSTGSIYIDDWDIRLSNIKVKNIGNAKSGAFDVCIYLSKDKNFGSSSDYLVRTVRVNPLNANTSTTLQQLNIELMKLNVPYGEYYVGIVIDCNDDVHESDEYNNECYYNEKVKLEDDEQADLVCKAQGSYEVDGDKLKIKQAKVKNQGEAKADASKVGVYLSTNTTFNGSDIFLGSINVNSLNKNASSGSLSGTFDLSGVPGGKYYIGLVIDNDDDVSESDEDNNICYWGTRITISNNSDLVGCDCESAKEDNLCENFENYEYDKDISKQSDCWVSMSEMDGSYKATTDPSVIQGFMKDSSQCLMIDRKGEDVVMMTGEREGLQEISFDIYIEPNSEAMISFMEEMDDDDPEEFFLIEFGAITEGKGRINKSRRDFEYPVGEWFRFTMYMYMDLGQMAYATINDEFALWSQSFDGDLEAIRFQAPEDHYNFAVDNIRITAVENASGTGGGFGRLLDAGQSTSNETLQSTGTIEKANEPVNTAAPANTQYNIYPNPSRGSFIFDMTLEEVQDIELIIVNATGQIVRRIQFDATNRIQEQIDLSDQPSGLYLIRAQAGKHRYDSRLLIEK